MKPFVTPPGGPTVLEIGDGYYQVPPNAKNLGFVGPMILIAGASGSLVTRQVILIAPAAGIDPLNTGTGRFPLIAYLGQAGLTGVGFQVSQGAGAFQNAAGLPIVEPGGPGAGEGFYATTPSQADNASPGTLLVAASATGGGNTYKGGATYYVSGGPVASLTLADTALAIQAAIVNAGLLPLPSVVISQSSQPFPSPAPPCCWIGLSSFRMDGPFEQGMGRYNPVYEGEYTVRVVLRRDRDVDEQDTQLLTNQAGGLPIVNQLINILLEAFPMSPSGIQLTSAGIKSAYVGASYNYSADLMMAVVPVTFTARIMVPLQVPYFTG